MSENKIYDFARDPAASVLSDIDYENDGQREIGNQVGIAKRTLVNKALRQSAYIASALAQYVVDTVDETVQDSDSVDIFIANLIASMKITSGFASGTKLIFYQAAAPVYWTKEVTNNDKALRVVSGLTGGGSGGVHDLSSPPSTTHVHSGPEHSHVAPSHTHIGASHSHAGVDHLHSGPSHSHSGPSHNHPGVDHLHSTAGHILSVAEMPYHSHTYLRQFPASYPYPGIGAEEGRTNQLLDNAGYIGSNAPHNHGNTGGADRDLITGLGGTGITSASGTGNTSGADRTLTTGLAGAIATEAGGMLATGLGGNGNTGNGTPTAFAPKYIDVIVCIKD